MSPNEWLQKPLGDVCEFIRGITFKPSDIRRSPSDGTIACLRTKNIQSQIDLSDLLYVPLEFVGNSKQLIKPGDILISSANSSDRVGKCCFIGQLPYEATLGGFITAARADRETIIPRYLYYWLNSPPTQERLRRIARKTTSIANLPFKDVKRLPIPLPPLPEQQRIADILDAADEARRLRMDADSEMEKLIPALFYEMFGDPATNPKGWKRVSLVPECADDDNVKCGPFGTQLSRAEFRSTGVPLWGIKHVNTGFRLKTVEFISDHKAATLNAYSILPGDIVMTRKGTVGKCAVYPLNLPKGIMHSDLLRLRPNEQKCNAEFLSTQLVVSKDVERQISQVSHGAVMAGINVTRLKQLKLHLPPLPLQQSFASSAAKIRTLQDQQAESAKYLDALFTSLLHRAFMGELTSGIIQNLETSDTINVRFEQSLSDSMSILADDREFLQNDGVDIDNPYPVHVMDEKVVAELDAAFKRRIIWGKLSDTQRLIWDVCTKLFQPFIVGAVRDRLKYVHKEEHNFEHIRAALELLVTLGMLVKVAAEDIELWRLPDPELDSEVEVEV